MKRKSIGIGLALSLLTVLAIPALEGCYASERIGKDIQDVSHDVNQGGIYMHKGALSVYRPERPAASTTLTNASLPAAPAAATPVAPTTPPATAKDDAAASPTWTPPADGSDPLPKKESAPAPAPGPMPAPSPAPPPDPSIISM